MEYWKLENNQKIQNPPSKKRYGSSVFTLREMEEATCSFSEEYLLGKGGFGRVYKGKLQSGEVSRHKVIILRIIFERRPEKLTKIVFLNTRLHQIKKNKQNLNEKYES